MLDSISSGLQAAVEATSRDHDSGDRSQDAVNRAPMEIYAFLLQWFAAAAERHTPKDGADAPTTATTKAKVDTKSITVTTFELTVFFP